MKSLLIAGFVQQNVLIIAVRVLLTEVSAEYRFILQKIWEENFGTLSGNRFKLVSQ